MGPDAELRVPKPVGVLILPERFSRRLERALGDRELEVSCASRAGQRDRQATNAGCLGKSSHELINVHCSSQRNQCYHPAPYSA